MRVLRWGRSAYETDAGLAQEAAGVADLGLTWKHEPARRPERLPQADALVVTSGVRVDGWALDQVGCRLVLTTTSGYDHIDRPACAERGVLVARSPMARRDAVVEHSLALLIALLRRLPALDARAAAGFWARGELPGLAPWGLVGLPIAVVGLGVIGERMARVLELLGADVMGVDPNRRPAGIDTMPLDEALACAQAVTLHCSLNPGSEALLHMGRLRELQAGAVVVNTSRGRSLDVQGAVELVRSGHLGGVAVDVFPEEPWRHMADAAHPGVLFSPHASGYTQDLHVRVVQQVVATLEAFSAGEPLPYLVEAP